MQVIGTMNTQRFLFYTDFFYTSMDKAFRVCVCVCVFDVLVCVHVERGSFQRRRPQRPFFCFLLYYEDGILINDHLRSSSAIMDKTDQHT